jgi:hypothetical protein
MNVNGNNISSDTIPESNTIMEKSRPRSLLKVISPKAQRAHHRQRPVEAGDPAVLLAFVDHQPVKHHAVDDDQRDERADEARKQADVSPRWRRLEEERQLRGEELHPALP